MLWTSGVLASRSGCEVPTAAEWNLTQLCHIRGPQNNSRGGGRARCRQQQLNWQRLPAADEVECKALVVNQYGKTKNGGNDEVSCGTVESWEARNLNPDETMRMIKTKLPEDTLGDGQRNET